MSNNVTATVHRGAMFMAQVSYIQGEDGPMLHQEIVYIRGLSQEGAEKALDGYIESMRAAGVECFMRSPVAQLPGVCTLIMPADATVPVRGNEFLLPCRIERTAFNENRYVEAGGLSAEFPYQHLFDSNKKPLARHLPIDPNEAMTGYLKVRWLRQDGKHSMVELPNGCAFDCELKDLVPMP
jgi:hypothetical protein